LNSLLIEKMGLIFNQTTAVSKLKKVDNNKEMIYYSTHACQYPTGTQMMYTKEFAPTQKTKATKKTMNADQDSKENQAALGLVNSMSDFINNIMRMHMESDFQSNSQDVKQAPKPKHAGSGRRNSSRIAAYNSRRSSVGSKRNHVSIAGDKTEDANPSEEQPKRRKMSHDHGYIATLPLSHFPPAIKNIVRQLQTEEKAAAAAQESSWAQKAADAKEKAAELWRSISPTSLKRLPLQKPHTDFSEEYIQKCKEKNHCAAVGFMPLEKCGMWIRYWKQYRAREEVVVAAAPVVVAAAPGPAATEDSDVTGTLLFIPYGHIVVIPMTLLHAGGYRVSATGSKRCHFYLYAGDEDNYAEAPLNHRNSYFCPDKPPKNHGAKDYFATMKEYSCLWRGDTWYSKAQEELEDLFLFS